MKEPNMSGHGEFPTPDDIRKRREAYHAAAAAQALKDVEAMLLRGANQKSIDWSEPVCELVKRALNRSGWDIHYSYRNQRDPGMMIRVTAFSGRRESYPPGG